jgi:hypothetical protein
LDYGFKAFKPWLHGTMPSGSWQEKMLGRELCGKAKLLPIMAARKQREQEEEVRDKI